MMTKEELYQREVIYNPHSKVIVTLEEDRYLVLYYSKDGEDFIELDQVPLDGTSSLDDIDNKINYLMAEYNLRY